MKVKLVDVKHYDKDRNENPLITRNNKPYIRCVLKTAKGTISGFGSTITKQWKSGDEVDIEIDVKEVNGVKYQNFKLPDQRVSREEFNLLSKKVKFLEDEIGFLHKKLEPETKDNTLDDFDLGDPPDGEDYNAPI